jgi:metal iron transporter
MPHSLFLGSALATQDRISPKPAKPISEEYLAQRNQPTVSFPRRLLRMTLNSVTSLFRATRETEDLIKPRCHADWENNTLAFVQAHLYHGIFDMAISLLGFAVIINSLYVPAPWLPVRQVLNMLF